MIKLIMKKEEQEEIKMKELVAMQKRQKNLPKKKPKFKLTLNSIEDSTKI